MSDHPTNTGEKISSLSVTLTFIQGLPASDAEHCLFLLLDGSIYSGAILLDSKIFRGGALVTINDEGGRHETYEIPLRQVFGYAIHNAPSEKMTRLGMKVDG